MFNFPVFQISTRNEIFVVFSIIIIEKPFAVRIIFAFGSYSIELVMSIRIY